MNVIAFLDSEDGVSPVISVVLMVAITVILASTAATLVFDFTSELEEETPHATFNYQFTQDGASTVDDYGYDASTEEGAGLLVIRHVGGGPVDSSQVSIAGGSYGTGALANTQGQYAAGGRLRAGDRIRLWIDTGDRIAIVWESEDGDQSATLGTYRGPRS